MINENASYIIHQNFFSVFELLIALSLIANQRRGILDQLVELGISPGVPSAGYPDAEHIRWVQVIEAVRDIEERQVVSVHGISEELGLFVRYGDLDIQILGEHGCDSFSD